MEDRFIEATWCHLVDSLRDFPQDVFLRRHRFSSSGGGREIKITVVDLNRPPGPRSKGRRPDALCFFILLLLFSRFQETHSS